MSSKESKYRHWCFTINNYTDADYPKPSLFVYLVIGKEVGEKGTPHLQGFCSFATKKRAKAVSRVLPRAYLGKMATTVEACVKYCKKDGDFQEWGEIPLTGAEATKRKWINIWAAAKAGKFEDIPADVLVRSYSNIKRIRQDYPAERTELADVCGEWFYGETGAGKSYTARKQYPKLFDKPLNKWWDGYREEETVLLDDVGLKESHWIGPFLLRWADKYSFPAEEKGTTVVLRPQKIIVTSQYTIEELFVEDAKLVDALNRRFVFIPIKREL